MDFAKKNPDSLNIIARQTSCTTCEIALSNIRNWKYGTLLLLTYTFYKNTLYKNTEAETGEKMRTK